MLWKKTLTVHNIVAVIILAASIIWLFHSLPSGSLYTSNIYEAKVLQIVGTGQPSTQQQNSSYIAQTLKIEVRLPGNETKQATIANNLVKVSEGDTIYVTAANLGTPDESFNIADVKRQNGMFWLAALLVGVSVAVGGIKGLKALIGLVASLAIVFGFIIPHILAGQDAIEVALLASLAIVTLNIYLTDGLSRKSLIAVGGIFITILFTALLTGYSVGRLHFTGFSGEEAFYLSQETSNSISLIGILAAGIIISALGVLDDVAVTQVSVVSQLAHADPSLHKWALFRKAMGVGRDHIAAVINTLALAYVGASLPLLLLLNVQKFAIGFAINNEALAVEIVRTLISTTSLVLSVPITTFLASLFHLLPTEHDLH